MSLILSSKDVYGVNAVISKNIIVPKILNNKCITAVLLEFVFAPTEDNIAVTQVYLDINDEDLENEHGKYVR